MALCKEIISTRGYSTNYHRVSEVVLHDSILQCDVKSYVSKNYRALEMPAERQHFNFEITIEEEESMGIRALCYKKIKELPDWADAEDC